MSSAEKLRAAGVLAGAGMASGLLAVYYVWRRRKVWGWRLAEALGPPEPPPALAAAASPTDEQLEIRWHLDSIQSCLDGLKAEVSALKDCIQGIVQRQAGLRQRKSGRRRKRRYEAKRDSDDSAESVSIYFTATAGKASDSESEAGQIGSPADLDSSLLVFSTASLTDDRAGLDAESPFLQFQQAPGQIGSPADLDSSLLAFSTASLTDNRAGLDAESPFLQFQQAPGYTTAPTDTEGEKEEEEEEEEEEDSNSVQVLNFSPTLEPEAEPVQCSLLPEKESNEMASLLLEVDRLHNGSKEEQEQGFKVLLDNKNKYGKRKDFCWRMIRAYSDMFQLTEDEETQKCYALAGRDEATASLQDHGDSIECQIWLAVVCGYLQDHVTDDRCKENEDLFKETHDEAGVHVEVINSCESIYTDAASNIPLIDTVEITEVTDKIEEQDMQLQHEGNLLVEVFNSYDTIFAHHRSVSATEVSETTDMEDLNKEQDMKALDEANMMVEFIDGYHITYSNECSIPAADTAKAADMESEQDEVDEDNELPF
uniref:regulator of microtubule dynamics protein 3-like n=1 Tax=Pristiophorus japonicus TaxID=55135 RepID=UPI00398F8AAC